MSCLPSQSWITPNNPLFLLANISSLTASDIKANSIETNTLSTGAATISSIQGTEGGVNIDFAFISSINSDGRIEANEFSSIFTYAQEGTVSTLFTQHVILDQATLDVINGNTLLLNGVPLATTSTSISSLQDWSFYPAIQTVDMNTFGLSNVGNINSQNIFNALNIQSDTFSGLTSITAPAATITNGRFTSLSTTNLQVSAINNSSNITVNQGLTATSLTAPSLSTINLSTATINGQSVISGSNWSQYPATQTVNLQGNGLSNSGNLTINTTSNTTINTGEFFMTADGGLNIASITNVDITAQNGNRGQINLVANSGNNNGVAGQIFLTANGGQVGGVGTGGTIELTANTPLGFSNLTSKITLNASGINSYAGSIPALASAYGYNFIYGQNGVYIASGLPPGLPNVPGTTYIYGTLGIEMPSDAYMKNIYPYFDGITTPPDINITGRYITPNLAQVCVRMSNVRQIDFQSNVATYMSNLDTLSMSGNGTIGTSNLTATNGTIGTLSNGSLVGTGGNISGYNNISASNLNITTINGAAYPPAGGGASTISTFTTASISSLNVSSINGQPYFANNFTKLFTSTLAFSTMISAGSNSGFVYPITIDYDQAGGSTNSSGVGIAVQGHNFGTGAVINRIEMGARGNGENYIMSVWPGANLEDLYIDATELVVRDSDGFSTIMNLNPYGLITNGIVAAPEVSTVNVNLSTINNKQYPTDPIYGEFLTTSTITVSAANTPTVIPLDTNTVGNGVSLNGGAIEVSQTGLYSFSPSIQFDKSGGGASDCDFWVRVNGNDVANSGSKITVQGTTGQLIGTVVLYLSLNANDLVELVIASADSSMAATYFAPWTVSPGGDPYDRPAIPAVITVIQLIR